MGTPNGSVSKLSYSRLAEITARLDAGEPRSEILKELGLGDEELHRAQQEWLATLGKEVLLGEFGMQRLCAREYSRHLEMAKAIFDGVDEEDEFFRPALSRDVGLPPAAIAGVALPPARAEESSLDTALQDSEPAVVQRSAVQADELLEPPLAGSRVPEPPVYVPVPIPSLQSRIASAPPQPVVSPEPPFVESAKGSAPETLVPEPPAVWEATSVPEPPAALEPTEVPEPPVVVTPPGVKGPAPAVSPPAAVRPPSVSSEKSGSSPAARPRHLPAQMGRTVSFNEAGFQIPGLSGNLAPPPPAAGPPVPVARPAQDTAQDNSYSQEPPAVPALDPGAFGTPSPFGQRRAPSAKPLPERLDFMTGSASGGTVPAHPLPQQPHVAADARGGLPVAASSPWGAAPPLATSPLAAPPLAVPLPAASPNPGIYPPASSPLGGAPGWANPGTAAVTPPAPAGFGGNPSGANPPPTGSVTQLSIEQLACIQAELDVDPQRFSAVISANGIDPASYLAQAERLQGDLVADPAKAQRFDQLREYYRAILGSP